LSLVTLFAFLLVLGGLIFIHEFGHFTCAKIFGVRVEVFSLGFGPRLLGFRRGHTDYRISAIPLGGYVKMLGENPDEEIEGTGEEFLSKSKPVRFAILVAGAGMNIVLAVVLYWILFMVGIQTLAFVRAPGVIGQLRASSPAEEAGLLRGDMILGLGGVDVPSWQDFSTQVHLSPNTDTEIRIRRDGVEMTLPLRIGTPPLDDERAKYEMGYAGVEPYFAPTVREVLPDTPAEAGGLLAGDLVLKVQGEQPDGNPVEGLIAAVQSSPLSPVRFTVYRDDREVELSILPEEVDGKGRIGAIFGVTEKVQYSPWGAMRASVDVNMRSAGLLFVTLRKLIVGKLSMRTMSGPVDIYKFSGEAFRAGWQQFLSFMAVVSLQLGIINLLPIPVLDGGHIFVLLLEGVIRRDLSMQLKERLMQFGFILLVTLMGVVISLDVIKNWVG